MSSLTTVRPVNNRRMTKEPIRPTAPTISTPLDAARAAAKVLASTQRTIDAEAAEIAELASALSARLNNVAALANVVSHANGDWNEQLATLAGLGAEAAKDAKRLASDLWTWLEERTPTSATVTKAATKAGKAVRK